MKFLNDGEDESGEFFPNDADGAPINATLGNLKRLKFDDQKWQIDASRFIIHGYLLFSKHF